MFHLSVAYSPVKASSKSIILTARKVLYSSGSFSFFGVYERPVAIKLASIEANTMYSLYIIRCILAIRNATLKAILSSANYGVNIYSGLIFELMITKTPMQINISKNLRHAGIILPNSGI